MLLQFNLGMHARGQRLPMSCSVPCSHAESLHILHSTANATLVFKFGMYLVLRLQHGDVFFHLCKPKPFNPFVGLDWQLSDGINSTTSAVQVKKALLSSSTTFETVDGASLTTLTQPFYKPYCEFSWEGCIYRSAFTKQALVRFSLALHPKHLNYTASYM